MLAWLAPGSLAEEGKPPMSIETLEVLLPLLPSLLVLLVAGLGTVSSVADAALTELPALLLVEAACVGLGIECGPMFAAPGSRMTLLLPVV